MAAKRELSPAPLPPPKRHHGGPPSARTIVSSFDNALYDELVLFIFSFLNSRDLCAAQAANKNCARLACDSQVLAYTLSLRDCDPIRLGVGNSSGRHSSSETLENPVSEVEAGSTPEQMAAWSGASLRAHPFQQTMRSISTGSGCTA